MSDQSREVAKSRINDLIAARRCIQSKYLSLEQELQETKWFAYRFMSPLQATRKFALAYQKFYDRAFAAHFNRNAKPRAVNWAEFGKPCRSMTQLWIGRQNADRLGVPYESYLEFFEDFNTRRPRKHLPRPNQIEGSKAAKAIWPPLLANFLSERAWYQLVRLEVPQLHVANFRGLAAQIAFQKWALDVVRTSSTTFAQALEQLAFRQGLLPPEAFSTLWEKEPYEEAIRRLCEDRRHGRIITVQAASLSTAAYWPTCFGLNATSLDGIACESCPFQKDCRKVCDRMSQVLAEDYSRPDADAIKRKINRERQARHRNKKKMKGS